MSKGINIRDISSLHFNKNSDGTYYIDYGAINEDGAYVSVSIPKIKIKWNYNTVISWPEDMECMKDDGSKEIMNVTIQNDVDK